MTSFKQSFVFLVFILTCAFANAGTIYSTLIEDASDLNSVLVTIDPNTGAVSELGSTGVNIQAMAYDSENNVLYGAGVDPLNVTANFNLYSINRTNGEVTLIGDMAWQFTTSMTYDSDSDELYAQVGGFNNYLTTVDRDSGLATQINASILGVSSSSIEYIPGSEQIVFVNNSGQYGFYDASDGSFIVSGTGGLSGVRALGYDASLGTLLGLSNNGLYTIDIDNGLATLLTDIPTGFYGSMAVVPIPVPGALLLLLSACGCLAMNTASVRLIFHAN